MSDPEPPLRLLSLDGGGIRGLSSLYILKNLLVAVQRKEPVSAGETASPRPCDYFDMIAGTSTGGLIAVMLGVLRMDIETCINAYLSMAPEIFPVEGMVSGSIFGKAKNALKGDQRFDPAPFEAAIKRLVRGNLGNNATGNEMMRSQSGQGCRVFVCVNSEKPRHPFRFRNYESPRVVSEDMTIWEACRATSAAPTYFPPVSIGNPPRTFVDGGLGYNNPTQALREETMHIWPSRSVGCIVSIGTGMMGSHDVGRSIKPLFKTLREMSTDTEKVALEVKEEMEHQSPDQDIYFRFNVQHGLQTVGLEEWKDMGRVKTVTENYLKADWKQVTACASQILSPTHATSSKPVRGSVRTFSTVPFSKDPGFVGREDILAQLESEFANPISQSWASLYGLGGIGKSQIAIEYSYRQKERLPEISTFWVHASDQARFEQSYTEIATRVEIPGTGDGKVDILQLVSKWLANPDNGRWLLILDNADDATVLLHLPERDPETGATSVQRRLLDFLPRVQHGAVLITSRDRTCALDLNGQNGTPLEVRPMSTNEAVGLLRNRLPDATEEEASELVAELERVPLAISQASAYIKAVSQVSISIYLKKFRRSNEDQATLLNKGKGDLRRDPAVPNAVITSWELSFRQIREKSPGSALLLSLMSYINRQGIPQFLLQRDDDDVSFYEEINPLISFSLIRAETRENVFEMHRLVQTAMRHWLRSEGCDQLWKESAIERVAHRFPTRGNQAQHWPVCEDLMSHADEVILHTASSKESRLSRAIILVRTACYLIERKGHGGLAEQRSTDALQIRREYFDDDSDEILTTMSILAYAQSELLKTEEARDLQEFILTQRREKCGSEHEDTLDSVHNLALSYRQLGEYDKAADLLKHVFEVRERLLDPGDPRLLASGNGLAAAQFHQGKYEDAEKLSKRLLEMSTKYHEFEYIHTLDAMENLSSAYLQQNKLEEAEKRSVQAIPICTEVFGPSHWRTLDARRLLADIYYRQNKLDEAQEICISCLDTAQQIYGAEDVTTANIINLLGLVYLDQGRFVDASRLLKDAAETNRKVFGSDHPYTLTSLQNLAFCYYDMGDKVQAIELMTDVLDKRKEVLHANHPETIWSAEDLARMKGEEEETKEEGSEEEENEGEVNEQEGSEKEGNEKEGNEEGVREQLGKIQISSPATHEAGPR